MDLVSILKSLANGTHPETGKRFPSNSVIHKPDAIRTFYGLIEELRTSERNEAQTKKKKTQKASFDDEERMKKNIAEGRPPRSHFPWSDEERKEIFAMFEGGASVETIAEEKMRGSRAIAIQLEKAGLISAEQLESYGK